MAGKDFFRQRHGAIFGLDRRKKDFFLQAGDVEGEQSAVFDYLACDLVFAGSEFAERNFFSGADFVDQRKVGGGQKAQVLAILFVDALNVFGNDQTGFRRTSRRKGTARGSNLFPAACR